MRKACWVSLVMASALVMGAAAAQSQVSDDTVKIGILTDMAGPYANVSGKGTVAAVNMAIEDFGGKVLGKPIVAIPADHQNKPDIAANIARKWIDVDKIDVIVDLPGSSVALAVQHVTREKKVATIVGTAGTTELIGKSCSPTTIMYVFDVYSLAKTAAKATVEKFGDTFFFLTLDNAFGASVETSLTKFLNEQGARVVGSIRHPVGVSDFSSYILRAQTSKAKVVVLAQGGADAENALKSAHEFGLNKGGQNFLALVLQDTDIHAVGPATANGLVLSTGFFRGRTEQARVWSQRYYERMNTMPNSTQAGAYSYTMNYLKAVEAAGTDDSPSVIAKMKSTPIDDFFAKGYIREDGKFIYDQYLLEVTSSRVAADPWDYFNLIDTVPGDVANQPLKDGGCPFVSK